MRTTASKTPLSWLACHFRVEGITFVLRIIHDHLLAACSWVAISHAFAQFDVPIYS